MEFNSMRLFTGMVIKVGALFVLGAIFIIVFLSPPTGASIAFIALYLASIGLLSILYSNNVNSRLREIHGTLDIDRQNVIDLNIRLDDSGDDEVSSIAAQLNHFCNRIQSTLEEISGATDQLITSASGLSKVIDSTNTSIKKQQAETDQVSKAMNEMSDSVQEVARSAANAADDAKQADQESREGKSVVGDTKKTIETLANEIEKASEVIGKLEHDSENIGAVLDVIRGIAEQTNLLALNAAIEAARAGEQGRGFAVVADEVRTLASRTQTSTQEIHEMIERLQSGAREAVEVMKGGREWADTSVQQVEKAGESLETITTAVEGIVGMNNQIASASEEQTAVASEINHSVTNISQGANEVFDIVKQSANNNEQLTVLSSTLKNLINKFKL